MASSFDRTNRISEEVKREVSRIIREDIKDSRIHPMTTIVRAEVSRDLRHAKIYASVLGSEAEREETFTGLRSASGYIRRQLGRKLRVHHIPQLVFVADDSIERSIRIAKTLQDIHQEDGDKDE